MLLSENRFFATVDNLSLVSSEHFFPNLLRLCERSLSTDFCGKPLLQPAGISSPAEKYFTLVPSVYALFPFIDTETSSPLSDIITV
nr:MAG TPA: hypothetical protein [Caudoviricetes sp.]